MTPFIGIYGVLIASILSDIYRSIDLLIFIPRKLTKLPVKLTVKRILMILVSTVIILLPFYQIRLNPSNYIEWGLYACIIGLYSCAVVFIVSFLFDRDTFKGITRRLKGMVRK